MNITYEQVLKSYYEIGKVDLHINKILIPYIANEIDKYISGLYENALIDLKEKQNAK